MKKSTTWAMMSFAVVAAVCFGSAFLTMDASAEGSDERAAVNAAVAEASIDVSGESGTIEGFSIGISDFSRAQVASHKYADDGTYQGYAFQMGDSAGKFAAVYMDQESESPYVVLHVTADDYSRYALDDEANMAGFKNLLTQLDVANAKGGYTLSADENIWYVTSDGSYQVGDIVFGFDEELKEGRFYATVMGADGSDITSTSNPLHANVGHCSFGTMENSSGVAVQGAAEGFDAFVEFITTMDYRPLWITLKTSLCSIVIIFVLGLLAAYWTLTLKPTLQNIMDAIFTIPMVLPPTVCGFLLLMVLGKKSPIGEWFINIGLPLVFSWPATVVAAVVVAFPLMYRSARGAFEGLDANMLDAARTLGWSNFKIFRKLMLPLSWTSIAAGTALSFARALGEFGATLFMAGNYAGITQTIPIAIYFQWMNGRSDVAMFWTVVIILVSFAVILFINIWSKRTTKYRRKEETNEP